MSSILDDDFTLVEDKDGAPYPQVVQNYAHALALLEDSGHVLAALMTLSQFAGAWHPVRLIVGSGGTDECVVCGAQSAPPPVAFPHRDGCLWVAARSILGMMGEQR